MRVCVRVRVRASECVCLRDRLPESPGPAELPRHRPRPAAQQPPRPRERAKGVRATSVASGKQNTGGAIGIREGLQRAPAARDGQGAGPEVTVAVSAVLARYGDGDWDGDCGTVSGW